MAFTPAEEARVLAIEKRLNELLVVIQNLANKAELRGLQLLRENEIEDLQNRVLTLESAVVLLQNDIG